MQMLADKELRESSPEMTVSSWQLRGKTWHIAFDSSEQWGDLPSSGEADPHYDPVTTAYLSLSRSFPLKRNVPRLLNVGEMRCFSVRGSILQY
jgi:hypothetical protein